MGNRSEGLIRRMEEHKGFPLKLICSLADTFLETKNRDENLGTFDTTVQPIIVYG
jgi:hypothetical protein